MDQMIAARISGELDHESACRLSLQLIGTTRSVERLNAILNVGDEPLAATPATSPPAPHSRRKNVLWSEYEDMRLLAGVHRFGLGAWGSVARFVGNNRVKTQCCQRWSRGLNPNIRRTGWTPEEDERLLALVECFGRKSWTRVATELGNRCDVQCRYRFQQLSQTAPATADGEREEVESSEDEPPPDAAPKTRLPPIQALIDQVGRPPSGSPSE
jgi:hypothetical protein